MFFLSKVKISPKHSHNSFRLQLQLGIGHLHDLLPGIVLLLMAVQLFLEVLPVVPSMRSFRTKSLSERAIMEYQVQRFPCPIGQG